MNAMLAKGEESLTRYGRGEITLEAAQAAHEATVEAMIDYASTLDGAASFKKDLAEGEAYFAASGDPDDEAANADIRRIIDEGATRAQANRDIENAYRASQGKPPLTTSLPQTLAQEQEATAQAAAAAEAKAAWAADPLGLRAADATRPSLALDGWTFHPDAQQVLSKHVEPVIPDAATMQSVMASHAAVAQTIANSSGGGDLGPQSPTFAGHVDTTTLQSTVKEAVALVQDATQQRLTLSEVVAKHTQPVIPDANTMASVIASHATVAQQIARPATAAHDAPEQVRYRELFEQRNNLKDSIYAKEQTAEDAADAHEIGELDAQLAAVEAEMESLETWRRR